MTSGEWVDGEWSWGVWLREQREKEKIKEFGIWNWVSGEGKGFEPQRRYDAKGTQRKICENLFNPLAYFFKHKWQVEFG